MRLALFLASLLIAAPARADVRPGTGTRLFGELGVAFYNANFVTSRGNDSGRVGIDGPALRLRAGAGFPVAPGLFLGPALGVDAAFVESARSVCCGGYSGATTLRLGLDGAYYVDRSIGFRVLAGFGLARASLRPEDASEPNRGALGAVAATGVYWTIGLARDYAISKRSRLGAVVRLESDVLTGRDGDHVYTLRTFTPSLSIVFLSHIAG